MEPNSLNIHAKFLKVTGQASVAETVAWPIQFIIIFTPILKDLFHHKGNMSMKSIPYHTQLSYSKTGVYRGKLFFLIFRSETRSNRLHVCYMYCIVYGDNPVIGFYTNKII